MSDQFQEKSSSYKLFVWTYLYHTQDPGRYYEAGFENGNCYHHNLRMLRTCLQHIIGLHRNFKSPWPISWLRTDTKNKIGFHLYSKLIIPTNNWNIKLINLPQRKSNRRCFFRKHSISRACGGHSVLTFDFLPLTLAKTVGNIL